MDKIKVMTILGTRPEIIRLSRVLDALDRYVDHKVVHTGQNYDYELNEVFFKDLGLRSPDFLLNVDTSSLGSVLGHILIEVEKVLIAERPDAVLILGDTNSSIAGLMAKRMKIPLYHMEAGNRCFDANVPEEVNRKVIDRIADFNLVYTEHSRRHLLSEGIPHRRVYLTGSPMNEVLTHYMDKINTSGVLRSLGLEQQKYLVASIHREENVDSKNNLQQLLSALEQVHSTYNMPLVVSTHPRTRKRLEELSSYTPGSGILFSNPFGFLDYVFLQKNAFCVISDSGTITEESAILQFPAVTVRNATERPEGLDTGSIVVTGLQPHSILQAIDVVTGQRAIGMIPPVPVDYQVTNVAQRVTNLIVGTAALSNAWDGVVRHDYD
jgi:UDP-N-acetylglucosamine 2-epimerase (non-hydrolysing)